jgi:hypothetical protein
LAEKMYNLRRREYVYKKTATGGLASHFSRLADSKEGSAVKTHRRLEVEKAHMPVDMWKL